MSRKYFLLLAGQVVQSLFLKKEKNPELGEAVSKMAGFLSEKQINQRIGEVLRLAGDKLVVKTHCLR